VFVVVRVQLEEKELLASFAFVHLGLEHRHAVKDATGGYKKKLGV
jgi:hypothetical protein